jgi:RNA polymerase sigma-70 factor, ECF subfamily
MDQAARRDPEFATLAAAARAGDAPALERILALTEDRLRRQVDLRLGTRLRASLRRSDVLQNAYLAVLDAIPTFHGEHPDEFVAWVAQIVENDIRRQHRWFGAKKRQLPSRTSQRNVLARILTPHQPTPSAEVADREQQAVVRAAMARLDPLHVQVLELTAFEQLSNRELAERLGRTEGACRMLLMRARTALALELDRMANEG